MKRVGAPTIVLRPRSVVTALVLTISAITLGAAASQPALMTALEADLEDQTPVSLPAGAIVRESPCTIRPCPAVCKKVGTPEAPESVICAPDKQCQAGNEACATSVETRQKKADEAFRLLVARPSAGGDATVTEDTPPVREPRRQPRVSFERVKPRVSFKRAGMGAPTDMPIIMMPGGSAYGSVASTDMPADDYATSANMPAGDPAATANMPAGDPAATANMPAGDPAASLNMPANMHVATHTEALSPTVRPIISPTAPPTVAPAETPMATPATTATATPTFSRPNEADLDTLAPTVTPTDGGTEFVLLKDSTECAGREEKVGHTDTLKGCSAKCLGRSQWFIYGKQGQRCSGNGCECFCEVPGGNECTQTSHSGFKLYKLSQVVSQGSNRADAELTGKCKNEVNDNRPQTYYETTGTTMGSGGSDDRVQNCNDQDSSSKRDCATSQFDQVQECANACSDDDSCLSFEWSQAETNCKIVRTRSLPKNKARFRDYVYCIKRLLVKFTTSAIGVVNGMAEQLARPSWATTQRCSVAACVPCDKKSSDPKKDGCLHPVDPKGENKESQYSYELETAANSDLALSSITILLRCQAGEAVTVKTMVEHSTNGGVTTYFNGVEKHRSRCTDTADWKSSAGHSCADYERQKWCTHGKIYLGASGYPEGVANNDLRANCCACGKQRVGSRDYTSSPPLLGRDGENEVVLMFERLDRTRKADAVVRVAVQNVRPDFSECEDKKACLGVKANDTVGLGSSWDKQQAKDLRESIYLQELCLTNPANLASSAKYKEHATVCQQWTACLKGSGRLDGVKQILAASGASKAPEINEVPEATPSSVPANPVTCHNPFVSDPQSWNCACHTIMTEKCHHATGDNFTACYRTQLCNDPKVCSSWKGQVCTAHGDGILRQVECKDNDSGLQGALKAGTDMSCAGLVVDCSHEEIGFVVRRHCPRTCGMCGLYPYKVQTSEGGLLQLDDALAGTSAARGWTLTPKPPRWTQTPTADQSCFVNPDAFDCDCYASKRRYCKSSNLRKKHGLRHRNGKAYTAAQCTHFFVCTHSQTCQSYKDKHCAKETALRKRLERKKLKIQTC